MRCCSSASNRFMPMPRSKKPSWTPATVYKVTKLPTAGPKPGQSVDHYMHGKATQHERFQRLIDKQRFLH